MGLTKLYYDYRDLFRSPRLALSGKKIWIFIVGNLIGFISYWILSYASLIISGMSLQDSIDKYGLYPCLFGHEAPTAAWIVYYVGISIWAIFILFASTAVSRVTIKQLKGNDFFSSGDAWQYVHKHWHAIVFTPIAISIIIFFFVLFASIFALLGTVPFIGEFLFVLPYLVYFFGSIFTIYTLFVLGVSLLYTPSIVGVYEEDTMGSVFNSYSITIGHAWRIILYHLLLVTLLILGLEIFSWFWMNAVHFINYVFGCEWFMGSKLTNISSYAASLVYPGWFQEFITGLRNEITSLFGFYYYLPNLFPDSYTVSASDLSNTEMISGIILAVSYFIIGLSILSYGLSILSVGETLMFIIFKKKSDDDDLLLRKDEDELEDEDEDEYLFTEDESTEDESTEDESTEDESTEDESTEDESTED